MKNVELGTKSGSYALSAPATPESPKMTHPQLHIECDEECLKGLKDLPSAGTMTVEYCVVRKSVRNEHEGRKTGCLDIDIMKIVSAKADEDDDDGSEALDKLAKDVYDE